MRAFPTKEQQEKILDAMLALHSALHEYDEEVSMAFCDNHQLSEDDIALSVGSFVLQQLTADTPVDR
jgi:hypothetical protein